MSFACIVRSMGQRQLTAPAHHHPRLHHLIITLGGITAADYSRRQFLVDYEFARDRFRSQSPDIDCRQVRSCMRSWYWAGSITSTRSRRVPSNLHGIEMTFARREHLRTTVALSVGRCELIASGSRS